MKSNDSTNAPARESERGAVALEWALLLGGIALPGFAVIKLAMAVLVGHYQMMTTLNSLPFM